MVTKLTEYEIYHEIAKDGKRQMKLGENRKFYETPNLINYAQYIISYITNFTLSLPPTIQSKNKEANNKIEKIMDDSNFYVELIKALKTLLIEGKSYFVVYEDLDEIKIEKQDRYNSTIIFRNAQNKKKTDLIIRYGYYKGMNDQLILWAEQYYKNGEYIYRESFTQGFNGALIKDKEERLNFKDYPIVELDLGLTYLDKIKPACEEISKITKGYAGVLEKLRLYIIKIMNGGLAEKALSAMTPDEVEAARIEKQAQERELARRIEKEDISTFFIDDRESMGGQVKKADIDILEVPDRTKSLREGLRDLEEKLCLIAQIPSLTDENFSGNTSGVALKYKTLGLKQFKNEIIRELTRGINEILKVLEPLIGKEEWEVVFYPDDLEDFTQQVDNITKLYDSELIDRKTALEYIKIGNADKIIENIKKEQDEELGYAGLEHGDD